MISLYLKSLFKRLLQKNPIEIKHLFISLILSLILTLLLQLNLAHQKKRFLTKKTKGANFTQPLTAPMEMFEQDKESQ